MPSMETLGWIFFPIFLAWMAWWYGIQFTFLLRRFSSRHWPVAKGNIQSAGVRRIMGPRSALVYGSFFKYSYMVNGANHAGVFAVICGKDHAQELQDTLNGDIDVRYNSRDHKVSFLSNQYDPRFGGIAATQNPEWLDGE